MRRFNLLIVIMLGLIVLPMAREAVRAAAAPAGADQMLAEADAMRAEKSFAIAREKYQAVLALDKLSDERRNRARVWLADVTWREGRDAEAIATVETELSRLTQDLPAGDLRAEAAESLGDLRIDNRGWEAEQTNKAIEAWIVALKYWESAKDLMQARPRYVALNFKIAESLMQRGGVWPYPRTPLLDSMKIWPPQPPETPAFKQDTVTWALRNILRVSKGNNDTWRTHALFLLGQLRSRLWTDDTAWNQEGLDALKEAIAIEPRNEWTDDAWFELGNAYQRQQDMVQALATYQNFIQAYKPGESQYYDSSVAIIKQITQLESYISNPQNFAEGSYLNLTLNYKNLDRATLRVSRLNIDTFIETVGTRGERGFNLADDEFPEIEGTVVFDEVLKTTNPKDYKTQQIAQFIEPQQPGVYQATLTSEGNGEKKRVQRIFLVSRLAVATKIVNEKALTFVSDADSGKAIDGAALTIFQHKQSWNNHPAVLTRLAGESNGEGTAETICPPADKEHPQLHYMIIARKGNQVAFVQNQAYWNGGGREDQEFQPQLYVITDRPAYRPNEEVHWKAILRLTDGRDYKLPDYKNVWAEIRDQRGDMIAGGMYTLNEFGTLDGSFTPTEKTPLGQMSLMLKKSEMGEGIGGQQLARLEEYKLPEYEVKVTPGKEQVKFGGKVPFSIDAQYYFGGPVAGAEVKVVVHRQPFRKGWLWPMPYPWLMEGDMTTSYPSKRSSRSSHGFRPWPPYEPEVVVLEQTLTTDAQGKAAIEVGELSAEEIRAAEENDFWGYTYRVEARVVDSSRREVTGNGSIKIARTAFAAYLTTERYLYLPGDKVKLTLKTLDPNDQPMPADGLVTIYRRTYHENKDNGKHPKTGIALPKGGYDDTELFKKPAVTPANGEATIEFDMAEAGVYLARFETQDAFGAKVEDEATFFVADKNSQQLGYRSGGVEIITGKASYQRGETASVLITTRRPGTAVWFAIEGENVHQTQVIQLAGDVQLVPIKITEDMEPNIYFTATAMYDYSAFSEQKRIVIPPVRRYLDVTLEADRTDYQPGEKAELRLTVKDSDGKPVAADFALGVADAAVWAIGGETAGDIRQSFWSATRGLSIQTIASPMQWTTQYWKPKKDKPGEYELVMREEIGEYAVREGAQGGSDGYFYAADSNRIFGPKALAFPESTAMDKTTWGFSGAKREMSMVQNDAAAPGAPQAEEPRLRTDFSATALWLGHLITGTDGKGTAVVTWPDSLTTWNAIARGIDVGSRVGETRIAVKTNKPIMVRPQAPRFFVQGDQATLSAIINNTTSASQAMQVRLDLTGLALTDATSATQAGDYTLESSAAVATRETTLSVRVPANAQRRIDWTATADTLGTATVRITIKNENGGDAVEKTYPVLEYGIEKQVDAGLKLIGADQTLTQTMTLELPEARREASEALTILIEPTLALTMVNALDYLADYPYGCVEQTLSRFVPAVVTKQTLDRLQIKKPDLEAKLPAMIDAGLKRLYDFQHADGGWSWWKEGAGDLYMSAYVVQGLAQAQQAGVNVDDSVLRRGAEFLRLALVKAEDQEDLAAFMLYAITSVKGVDVNEALIAKAFEWVYANREKLNAYTRALLTLACHAAGRTEWTDTLTRNLRNGVKNDPANGTASWGEAGVTWHWSDNGIESTAFTLRALLAADPQNELIDPAMTWLTRNRKGNRWKNTRDTAIAISALADYIKVRGEDKPDWTATVKVNGEVVSTLKVTPETLFDFNGKLEVPRETLRTGANTITIERTGAGVLYGAAWMTFFTREKPIKANGYEVYVTRKYFRTSSHETLAGEYKKERDEIAEGTLLTSGDRVEVELTVESKNNYQYLVLEDPKPAGMEPTELQSGWEWGGGLGAHREFRDQRTAFFFSRLPQGKHVITYELRAEIPGVFQALPSQIQAMYVPEIRGNADSRELGIVDKSPGVN